MAKIIALDIGGKRTGVAETDVLQIIASPRETVLTQNLQQYLQQWLGQEEPIEAIVVGLPLHLDGGESDNSQNVQQWVKKLRKLFPAIPLYEVDERYSSKEAARSLIESGVKKKKRQARGALDATSAAIILQRYLEERG